MIYVDQLQAWGWRMYGREIMSCHMIADTPEELHAMALDCGLLRRYAQRSARGDLHYDLTPTKRKIALEIGAIELDRAGFVAKLRSLRA